MVTTLNHCNMIDIPTMRGFFTWRRNVQNGLHAHKKLDMCLANPEGRTSFLNALVEPLPCHNFDHNPLFMASCRSQSKKNKDFHFQAAWISHSNYSPLVNNAWRDQYGSIFQKLVKAQQESVTCNKENFWEHLQE